MKYPKITSSIWGTLEDTIITGHEGGEIMLWNMRKKSFEKRIRPHQKQVMDLQKDKDASCFISASKDYTAKVSPKSFG
jgi:translation initiation factor 3 subunit I